VSTVLAASTSLDFSLTQKLTVIVLSALTAYISHMALAVFNDGTRPFMLDFIQGRSTRTATAAVAFGLSAGFIFGLGAPMALSSGVLNPWLLFLPTDILGATIWHAGTETFEFHPGPVFANVVLVDELNRATPKTQTNRLFR